MSASDSAVALLVVRRLWRHARSLRRRARLTQRELSIAVGYSEAHLSRLEQTGARPTWRY